jgi:hypothetical protein
MGRSILIRDRELVSSNYFIGWVDKFSGLEVERCLSKNEIKSESLLIVFIFFFFFDNPLIYGVVVCSNTRLLIIIYFQLKTQNKNIK